MNDAVLAALLNLFALISARNKSPLDKCVKIIDNYLGADIGLRNKRPYIDLFTDFVDLHEMQSEADDEVSITPVCEGLKSKLEGKDLMPVILRLLEFYRETTDHFNRNNELIIKIAKQLKGKYRMNDGLFLSNVKDFLSKLLNDPVNAQPSETLLMHNLDRNTLLKYLKDYGVIVKKEKLSNKDKDGNPKELTMKVKYGLKGNEREKREPKDEFDIPRKKFETNVLKLYIDLFESNLPQPINEDGEGGDAGSYINGSGGEGAGPFVTKIGFMGKSMMTQASPYKKTRDNKELDETTTTFSVGSYQYDLPAFIDDETADRGEKNGSVSVEVKK